MATHGPEALPVSTRRGVLAAVLLLPLLTLLPVVAGIAQSDPPRREFLGFAVLPLDHAQYASFAEQARDGHGPFLRNLMTSEEHEGRFLAAVPWTAGRLARLPSFDVRTAWWALQYAGAAAVIAATWACAGAFTRSPSERLAAFVLAVLVGGFEWIPWLLARCGAGPLKPLAVLTEAYWNWNVTSSAVVPLWSIAQALLLVLVIVTRRQAQRPGAAGWAGVALLAFATWVAHPYTGAAAFVVVAAASVSGLVRALLRADRPDWGRAARRALALSGVAVAVAVAGAYAAWASADPVVAHAAEAMTSMNRTFNVITWPLVMGAPLLLALYGLRALREDDSAAADVLLGWLGGVTVLCLSPWMSGYRFQFLLWVPVAILGARGLTWLRSRSPRLDALASRRGIVVLAVAVGSISTLLGPLARCVSLPHDVHAHASSDELACLDAVRGMGEGVVAGPPERGPLMAWRTQHPVLGTHHFLTIDPERRSAESRALLDPATHPALRAQLLGETRARWIVLPPASASLSVEPWGRIAFTSGEWRVAEVLPSE